MKYGLDGGGDFSLKEMDRGYIVAGSQEIAYRPLLLLIRDRLDLR